MNTNTQKTHPSEIDMAVIYMNTTVNENHLANLKKSYASFNKKNS